MGPASRPSRLDIDLADAPVDKAIEQLSRFTGQPIPLHPPDLLRQNAVGRVTLHLKQATFWQTLEEIGRQTGLEPLMEADDQSSAFRLGMGKGFWATPHSLAGPLAIFPVQVQRSVTVELGKPRHKMERALMISLVAYPQPGVRVLAVRPMAAVTEAVDDAGRSLLPEAAVEGSVTPSQSEDAVPTGVASWDLTAELKCPAEIGKSIARLRGTATLRVETRSQRLEIENIATARNILRQVGGANVTIKSLKKVDQEHIVAMTIKRGRAPEQAWNDLRQSLTAEALLLLDARGRLVGRGTGDMEQPNDRTIEVRVHFAPEEGPKAGEPFKMVWETPVEAKEVHVEFQFKDLPLPG